ncbi:hypothetical protein GGI43DRAFT_412324 [Trichoderma evansii]
MRGINLSISVFALQSVLALCLTRYKAFATAHEAVAVHRGLGFSDRVGTRLVHGNLYVEFCSGTASLRRDSTCICMLVARGY